MHHRGGLPELIKLRGGTNRLRIEKGRYRNEEKEERLCVFCELREVEDEQHFMLTCDAYMPEREKLWKEYESIYSCTRESLGTTDAQLCALIGHTHQPEEEEAKDSERTLKYKALAKAVMIYISTSMAKRKRLEQVDGLKSIRVDAPGPAACS